LAILDKLVMFQLFFK